MKPFVTESATLKFVAQFLSLIFTFAKAFSKHYDPYAPIELIKIIMILIHLAELKRLL